MVRCQNCHDGKRVGKLGTAHSVRSLGNLTFISKNYTDWYSIIFIVCYAFRHIT